MAELNLKQIIDRLNTEFTGDTRKLVFWYDDKAEFVEDMEAVKLDNAEVYYLTESNQFKTKCYLERDPEGKTKNFLIYAPFPKPDVKDNHLEDTMLYSKRFYADRASLLSVDLGIEEKYKPIIEKYIKFFANKERTQRFYDLEIENFNEENILIGLLCAICKTKTCSFEEVVRIALTEYDMESNEFLKEIAKYDLVSSFWKLCEQHFGYMDSNPSLEKLLVTMFVTYTDRYMPNGIPKAWTSFVSTKPGNNIAFLDNLMNSVIYRDKYDELADFVSQELNVVVALAPNTMEDIVQCDAFAHIDKMIQKWIVDRLVAEDTGAKVNEYSIVELCDVRSKMHFGEQNQIIYSMLRAAYRLIQSGQFVGVDGFKNIINRYVDGECMTDWEYRKFYYYFDKIEDTEEYEQLQTLIENIYTNEYLGNMLPKWNEGILEEDSMTVLPLQRKFYDRFVANSKDKVVVIISDAMRYEVGRELFVRMQDNQNSTAKIQPILSTLPSYTRLGMAALLPHKKLELTDDYKVLVDGQTCDNLASRQLILQNKNSINSCYLFDDIKKIKSSSELKSLFAGKKKVTYIYHNQIDARGDKINTEDEVFVACEEAITEVISLIRKIASNANAYHFIVTADHGFIYKRDKLDESDKIGGMTGKDAFVNRRFVVSKNKIEGDGVGNIGLGYILGNDDDKVVSYPISSNVFKVPGGGQNFVHGGSSPQEMIVPVIDIKMDRSHVDIEKVKIALVSMVQKITNLIATLDFIQSDPVSDVVKQATYRMVFMSENGDKISNENEIVADSRELDSSKRITRVRFNFKNQKYDRDTKYYLVVYDASTEVELFRHQVVMDIAMADDFGW